MDDEEGYWSDNNWAVSALESIQAEVKQLQGICGRLEDKLVEGRNLVDMYATDLPELTDWSKEVDRLLEEKS